MYNYSPIKSIRVKNFRNIGDVELNFEDSPIITLVGSNEAGKTSIIKAFSACALHANPREQKDWIRDTTKMFGVEITLADGTQVIRVKEDGGINLYRIIYPDGRTWDVSKITDGLPVQVQQVMGLIEEQETGEFLHIRTYEDKLLFVVTPDSVNYKVMYNALKVEQLTKAIKIGSTEVNSLKQEVSRNEDRLQTLRDQLRTIKIIDISALQNIKDRLQYQLGLLDKLEKALEYIRIIKNEEVRLGAIGLIDRFNLQPIDEIFSSNLMRVSNNINSRSSLIVSSNILSKVETLDDIDTSLINRMSIILNRKAELQSKIVEAGMLVHIDKISSVDESLVVRLSRANQLISKLGNLQNQLDANNSSDADEITDKSISVIDKLQKVKSGYASLNINSSNLEKIVDYIEQVQEYLKQCGVAVESCPKCGEAVIFDIDKLEGQSNVSV